MVRVAQVGSTVGAVVFMRERGCVMGQDGLWIQSPVEMEVLHCTLKNTLFCIGRNVISVLYLYIQCYFYLKANQFW